MFGISSIVNLKGFIGFAVCSTVLFCIYISIYSNGSALNYEKDLQTTLRTQPRLFNIAVNANSYLSKCQRATLRVPGGSQAPICVYKASEDIWVSGSIIKHQSWEWENVVTVWKLMKPVKDMAFLDLGCNIGAFTIPMAKLRRRVIAVDANKENLKMLAASLHLGGLDVNVTLVWNGVSNETKYVHLVPSTSNVGGTKIEQSVIQSPTDNENSIITIQLDDMVTKCGSGPFFMKMDIETHEAMALRGAATFFKEIDVRYILMEWMHYKDTKDKKEGSFITDFLSKNSFIPCRISDSKELVMEDAYSSWPNDILWIKKSI
ncbi:uncharacterized protein LOC128204435 [Mya arenaria]|uniref:uncharacterized protein LOC128204435 n=1 Tax=Mya arenaria TaxID=6604 RepID=UPI0022DF4011|nr:uncharacterized protein LOC128204435 [Mya arenaria]